jgi:hypothetical protein
MKGALIEKLVANSDTLASFISGIRTTKNNIFSE